MAEGHARSRVGPWTQQPGHAQEAAGPPFSQLQNLLGNPTMDQSEFAPNNHEGHVAASKEQGLSPGRRQCSGCSEPIPAFPRGQIQPLGGLRKVMGFSEVPGRTRAMRQPPLCCPHQPCWGSEAVQMSHGVTQSTGQTPVDTAAHCVHGRAWALSWQGLRPRVTLGQNRGGRGPAGHPACTEGPIQPVGTSLLDVSPLPT